MEEPLETQLLLKRISTYSPEIWHKIALAWNWDNGITPLTWTISQPTCDKGTALLIYWRSGPGYMAKYKTRNDVPEYEQTLYDLIAEIERKYVNGFYKTEAFAFDPQLDQGTDWTTQYVSYPQNKEIPPVMYETTKGTQVTSEFVNEGYPPEVWEEATKMLK